MMSNLRCSIKHRVCCRSRTLFHLEDMSGLTLQSVSTAENEFFAEETLITISTNFDHEKFFLTSGTFGPFDSGDNCVVPLWLAINLRKRQKCTIVVPDWMSVESLEQNVEKERNENLFEPLPFYYREISQLILVHAREDVQAPDTVAALLQDIQSIRIDRAKLGMIGNLRF